MDELDITLTAAEIEAVIKSVQIGKNKVGRMIRGATGGKLTALRAEYQALADAEAELSEVWDTHVVGAA